MTIDAAIVPPGHPIYAMRRLLLSKNTDLTLEFSRYVHFGPGRTLSRKIFQVEATKVDAGWLKREIFSLSPGQELALHSKVLQKHRIWHIPMVDFVRLELPVLLLEKTQTVRQFLPVDITLFNSGRAMHGYYFCLINEKAWYEYLGRLLLCNSPSETERPLIDSRWVGHSLEHGFSALRWTRNSAIYQSLPEVVDTLPMSCAVREND